MVMRKWWCWWWRNGVCGDVDADYDGNGDDGGSSGGNVVYIIYSDKTNLLQRLCPYSEGCKIL